MVRGAEKRDKAILKSLFLWGGGAPPVADGSTYASPPGVPGTRGRGPPGQTKTKVKTYITKVKIKKIKKSNKKKYK